MSTPLLLFQIFGISLLFFDIRILETTKDHMSLFVKKGEFYG